MERKRPVIRIASGRVLMNEKGVGSHGERIFLGSSQSWLVCGGKLALAPPHLSVASTLMEKCLKISGLTLVSAVGASGESPAVVKWISG